MPRVPTMKTPKHKSARLLSGLFVGVGVLFLAQPSVAASDTSARPGYVPSTPCVIEVAFKLHTKASLITALQPLPPVLEVIPKYKRDAARIVRSATSSTGRAQREDELQLPQMSRPAHRPREAVDPRDFRRRPIYSAGGTPRETRVARGKGCAGETGRFPRESELAAPPRRAAMRPTGFEPVASASAGLRSIP